MIRRGSCAAALAISCTLSAVLRLLSCQEQSQWWRRARQAAVGIHNYVVQPRTPQRPGSIIDSASSKTMVPRGSSHSRPTSAGGTRRTTAEGGNTPNSSVHPQRDAASSNHWQTTDVFPTSRACRQRAGNDPAARSVVQYAEVANRANSVKMMPMMGMVGAFYQTLRPTSAGD
jgi:hypothetical protein